jgi:TolA-binding protein
MTTEEKLEKMEQRIAALERHVEELKHWEEEAEQATAIRRMKLQAYAARHEHERGSSW